MKDGGPMFEGGVINLWLAAKFPEAGMIPDIASLEGREALKWLFFAMVQFTSSGAVCFSATPAPSLR